MDGCVRCVVLWVGKRVKGRIYLVGFLINVVIGIVVFVYDVW